MGSLKHTLQNMIKTLISVVKAKAPYRVIHPCSMIFPTNCEGNTIGHVNPVHLKGRLQNAADLDLLYSCRALSGSILTSGKNVRLEAEWDPSIYVPRIHFPSSAPRNDQRAYPYASLRQQVWGASSPAPQTFILTKGELPPRVLDLSKNEQDNISTCQAEDLAMALNNLFDNNQGPVCLEVGPSTWLDLYKRAHEPSYSRFNVALALSSFHLTKESDALYNSLAIVKPELNLQELVHKRGLKKVFQQQEPQADGITFKLSLY
eukprot:CAMPEP_0204828104 /NCGR_PEP_ID=MMETSP1346-20131115/5734_1 /ASSEMBLY_ACC=CAM_ASM_000771 /TAXON_ID=215587 /ORGANISM="Aplanochytrium stocchinoi, Strain GSBS06" /LENGTH=261 /DNA_ID=CAMNT_0051956927 /DNA_START=72 /DNA_END=854 /DNA_ORIENTATION=+